MGESRKISEERRYRTYGFVSWVYHNHREELSYLMRHGVPSTRLIELGELNTPGGLSLPRSLNTRRGQADFVNALRRVRSYYRSIPVLSMLALGDCRIIANTRRTEQARVNAYRFAEMVCGFAAATFDVRPMMSFRVMSTWQIERHSNPCSNSWIDRQLEFWESQERSPIIVIQHGEAKNYGKSTIFRLAMGEKARYHSGLSLSRKRELQAVSDKWVDELAPANESVFTAIKLIQRYDVGGFRGHFIRSS